MISLLFAMSKNHVIGKDNDLPWHLPNDLKFYKGLTTSQTIIMGRKTYDSLNGALPDRENIVLTTNPDFSPEDAKVIHAIDDIKKMNESNPKKEWFVIGGEEIFRHAIHFADRMYMTYIDKEFEGDTFFPSFKVEDWVVTKNEKGKKDEKNPYDYYFIQFDRKKV